jgi:hypothetical protein
MKLQDYIAETQKVYSYRLKTIFPMDDDVMDKIEQVCLRYSVVDLTKPIKTILQKNPLDFQNTKAAEVYMVDLTFKMPASSYVLAQEFRVALGAPENSVIVKGLNDPTEVENEHISALDDMDAEAKRLGMKQSGLLNDPTYSEVTTPTDLYGAVHNQKFLDVLRAVQKEREAAQKIDAPNALFKWMDLPDQVDADDMAYNKDIKDAPKLGDASKAEKGNLNGVSNAGNLTDVNRVYKRQYGKDGKVTMMSRKVNDGV